MDYKIGDKVLYADGKRLKIFGIKKISKDKTQFLANEKKYFDRDIDKILSTRKAVYDWFFEQVKRHECPFYGIEDYFSDDCRNISVLLGGGYEDKYDDIYHIALKLGAFTYEDEVSGTSEDDVPDLLRIKDTSSATVSVVRSPDSLVRYILDKYPEIVFEREESKEENLLDRYNEWLENNDYFARDKIPTDWNGKTEQLVYMIENDGDPEDYDVWQSVQKHFGSEMSLDSALEIARLLEKENIAI